MNMFIATVLYNLKTGKSESAFKKHASKTESSPCLFHCFLKHLIFHSWNQLRIQCEQ